MRGLLHRIASENPSQRARLVESVLANLQAILNTERGGGPCTPGLGLDLQRLLMRWPASRHETLLEIERLIRQFEPRLQIVNVSLMEHENPNRITVLIEAEFEDGAFCAKTELTSLGGVTVRPSEVG